MAKACFDCGNTPASVYVRGKGHSCTTCAVRPEPEIPSPPKVSAVTHYVKSAPTLGDLLYRMGMVKS